MMVNYGQIPIDGGEIMLHLHVYSKTSLLLLQSPCSVLQIVNPTDVMRKSHVNPDSSWFNRSTSILDAYYHQVCLLLWDVFPPKSPEKTSNFYG